MPTRPTFTTDEIAAEQWRPIARFPWREISSLGRIRLADNPHSAPHDCHSRTNRYLKINLPATATRPAFSANVHALVAETFIGPRPVGMYVCHNDGNSHNNRAGNLSHKTPAGNSADRREHGTGSALHAFTGLLGVLSDGEVARRAGVKRGAVQMYRARHNIPRRPTPTK